MFEGIAAWPARWAALKPDAAALIFDDEPVTWAAFDRATDRIAAGLQQLGIGRGDRVAVFMRNRPEFLEAFFAITRLGAIVVPLNHFLTAAEIGFMLDHAGVRAVITHDEFAEQVEQVAGAGAGGAGGAVEHWLSAGGELPVPTARLSDLPDARPSPAGDLGLDDPASILYTSGTTGRPKGAITTHGGILHSTLHWLVHVGLDQHDVILNHLPLAFTGGTMAASMPAIHMGATMVLERAFEPARILSTIARHRVSFTMGVPTMWKALLDHPDFASADLSSLRLGFIGAAPVPVSTIEAFQRRGVLFVQAYALTEGNGLCLALPAEDASRKIGSCGLPLLYCDARVADDDGHTLPPGEVGELLLRGPVVFPGYWHDPEASAAALAGGWLHTGDLARQDDEGYVTIVDRKKDLIISGGLNVYPAEVEAALYTIDEVAEAAVVGLPHEHWGEQVTAFIASKPGRALDAEAVLDRCRRTLAAYKVPKEVRFLEALPKTMSGKILRRSLRDEATVSTS